MTLLPDEVLDDPAALEARDSSGMLPAVASAAAQVREAAVLSAEAGLGRFAEEDRPRAVVVLGLGASGLAGEVMAAVAGPTCPAPVVAIRGHQLPPWVGAADLVVAVSGSGTDETTLAALEEGVRRGSRLLVVGAAGSPLELLASRGRAAFVPVPQGRPTRASLWSLVIPLVVAGDALGLLTADPETVELTAGLLEQLATRCRPVADTALNPAKSVALALLGRVPAVWGTSALTGVAAHRFASQLAANAKTPATYDVLPEAGHASLAVLDGPFAGGPEDLFADPDDESAPRLSLVLLRDTDEHPPVARRATIARDLARARGVGVSELQAEGSSALERVASLLAVGDWASTYLALAQGTDPTPVEVREELEAEARR